MLRWKGMTLRKPMRRSASAVTARRSACGRHRLRTDQPDRLPARGLKDLGDPTTGPAIRHPSLAETVKSS